MKTLARAMAHAVGAGLAATVVATPVFAQQAQKIEKIEVTGSNIRRVEGETALPVTVITREDIQREGIQTTMELVERLSSNSSIGGLNLAGSEGSTGTGYASASLRGLGAQRTLVLLNGRRLANTAFSGATVDINSIPLSVIDRVEVLTDGASAVYGTDAIAGVINFILRKDFTGAEGFAYYGDSEHGGGKQHRYSATLGWGDLDKNKFNAFASFDYNKSEAIAANQRPFSATSYIPDAPGGRFDRTSGNSFPGNVFLPAVGSRAGTTQNPTYPTCAPPFSFGTATASTLGQCRFDFASVIDIAPPSETYNAFASGRWQIAPNHQLFAEGLWQRTKSIARVSPAPISSATILSGDPVLTIPGSPFYPTALATRFGVNGQPLEVFWRGLELGPRTDENKIEQSRVLVGLQGTFGRWDYSTALNWSESKATDSWLAGWAKGSTLLPILNSGRINLFGFNTPAAVQEMLATLITGPVIEAKGESTEFDFRASNEIMEMRAGPLALAVGGSYRKEKYEFISSQATRDADVPGLGGSISTTPSTSRNVYAVFGELNVPIVKTLEANFAVRFDDYKDVGNTTNPKASIRWSPTRETLIRASYGTGFRAPSLPELFQPAQFGATGGNYDDPLRCPRTGSPRDCNAQFTTKLGGNPDLKPEKSKNFTIGAVFEPTTSFSAGVDFFRIKMKDVVGLPAEEPIFTDMVAAEAAGLIVRYAPGSVGCGTPTAGLPCPVNFGVQTLVNLTEITTSGFDLNAAFRAPRQSWGTVGVRFNGTYLYKWDQRSQGGDIIHLAGEYGGGVAATVAGSGSTGGFPRWKHTAAVTLGTGPFLLTLTELYVLGYRDADGIRRVGSFDTYGLNLDFTGIRNLTLSAGVKNVLDREPPYTRQSNSFQIGYDPSLADPTGRFYYASVRFRFK